MSFFFFEKVQLKPFFFKANSKQNQTTIDESKENNSIQQLTAGLITFLHIRTSLMKLYDFEKKIFQNKLFFSF